MTIKTRPWKTIDEINEWVDIKLAESPQRPWVGLTDEELSEVYNNSNWDFKQSWDYERAIEDKLRSKNT